MLVASLSACAGRSSGSGEVDMTVAFREPPDLTPSNTCLDDRDCMPPLTCLSSTCQLAAVSCTSDDDCDSDTRCACGTGGGDAGPCVGGVCEPWKGSGATYDPLCASPGFPQVEFKTPVEKCHWSGGNVIMTPLVVDLNKDRRPEIVFSVWGRGLIVAIHGDTCQELWRLGGVQGTGFEQFAAADFDGDGFPEIVAPGNGGLLIIDHSGKIVASTKVPAPAAGSSGGPAIADVDGVAPPEIGYGSAVYHYERQTLTQMWSKPYEGGTWGTVSLFADLDGDGLPELVTGLHVYDGQTGNDKTPKALSDLGAPGGYPAVADFNKDGKPDIIIVQSAAGKQKLSVVDFVGNKVIFGPYAVQGGGWGGTPTLGDYDGDRVPDIGLASQNFYYVYALKCAGINKPKDCMGADPGVLWQRPTHDFSSGGTGSSTFDFNGDGISEVVYRDECWLRVYNGPNGRTVFAVPISSETALEYPVIADVDNSGHASIVVPSDNVQGMGCVGTPEGQLVDAVFKQPTQGVFVLSDPMQRWMPSRPLWHQHTYHITEIGDDLLVPTHEDNNWASWNNYRVNVQGKFGHIGALPDFTGGYGAQADNGGQECDVSERLWAFLCNRGGSDVAPGVPGTFYASDPSLGAAVPICTATTTGFLFPGDCEPVHCDRKNPPVGPQDLWFRANDNGVKQNIQVECKTKNGLLYLPRYECKNIG